MDELLANTEWAPFIKTIIRVTRHTWLRHAATGLWDQRRKVAHYISSAEGLRASTWADIVRPLGAPLLERAPSRERPPYQ